MANMFRCVLASGGALILTVTCDSVFAGQTITCTDGITTLTQICPSSSPYTVEFKIPNAGIWTISSGTTSTSVTIPSSAELNDIPNGSTITPTDGIQIWLHCANIWDKAYTTISQVLADVSTLQALVASNNAVDYMARSTTWASSVTSDSSAMSLIGLNDYCADSLLADSTWLNAICNSTYFESVLNVKVPTMTSNTTPSGKAFGLNTVTDSRQPWKAFNKSSANDEYWADKDSVTNSAVGYKFTQQVKIYKFNVLFLNSRYARAFDIQGSNDGNTYTTIYSKTGNSGSVVDDIITDSNNYQYYRIYKITGSTVYNTMYVDELQFYGRASS